MDFTISSGHSKYVSGANGYISEVAEARKVTDKVAVYLKQLGSSVNVYHDDVSRTQNSNVNNIVAKHNATKRDFDVSIHFNAFKTTDESKGVEVCYVTQKEMAAKVSKGISDASGLKDRGGKYRDKLGFLNGTKRPSILIEICFVDSSYDTKIYKDKFDAICRSIAESLTGKKLTGTTSTANINVNTGIKTDIKTDTKEDVRMYKPSNAALLNSTRVILTRLASKGDTGISKAHVEKLDKGELPLDDVIGLLYTALEREMFDFQAKK